MRPLSYADAHSKLTFVHRMSDNEAHSALRAAYAAGVAGRSRVTIWLHTTERYAYWRHATYRIVG